MTQSWRIKQQELDVILQTGKRYAVYNDALPSENKEIFTGIFEQRDKYGYVFVVNGEKLRVKLTKMKSPRVELVQ